MKGRHKLKALVLSSRKSGEADRLVTLFTREHGIVRAIAKGARRLPSRRGGHLEPMTAVLALVSMTRAGSFIGAVETIDYFLPLREADPKKITVARLLGLMVTAFFEEGQVEAELFDALWQAWEMLPGLSSAQEGMIEAAMTLFALQRAGLMPDLQACQVCALPKPDESILLDGEMGGWRCLTCHTGFEGTQRSLPPVLLKVLRFIHAYPARALHVKIDEPSVNQLVSAVRHYAGQVADNPAVYTQIAYVS